MASRPNQALIWNQAGGSLMADSAGLWWASMSKENRVLHPSYINNQNLIQSKWDDRFGDRTNEIVIIGHNLNQEEIQAELDTCLATESELNSNFWKKGYEDQWAVNRVYPMN